MTASLPGLLDGDLPAPVFAGTTPVRTEPSAACHRAATGLLAIIITRLRQEIGLQFLQEDSRVDSGGTISAGLIDC
jgi:hypothetical protein